MIRFQNLLELLLEQNGLNQEANGKEKVILQDQEILYSLTGKQMENHTMLKQWKRVKEDIYTIEGNSTDDGCRAKKYSINSNVIYGLGLPSY